MDVYFRSCPRDVRVTTLIFIPSLNTKMSFIVLEKGIFLEARLYLGVDGQRQWNDLAAARTTPVRLALFSLVALFVQRQPSWQQAFRRSAGYKKARPTFADALAQVRHALWRQLGFWLSEAAIEEQKSASILFEHFAELLAYVA
jgi:hypothetical protein